MNPQSNNLFSRRKKNSCGGEIIVEDATYEEILKYKAESAPPPPNDTE